MQTSTIAVARSINAGREQAVGEFYPFSAQYKGSGWYVYNAALNAWGSEQYKTAREADNAARLLYEGSTHSL